MTKLFRLYGVGQAIFDVLPPPQYFENAPTIAQTNFHIGQVVYTGTVGSYLFYVYAGDGVWDQLTTAGTGFVSSIAGTAGEITASSATGPVTLSVPAAFVAPGSVASTTTLTGGTGVTATTGNLTASEAGSGLLLTPTVVAAGASPLVANGRVGQVTFSGVSIASGATQTFVITNSAITGSGTVILYGMTGATAGSALTIESVTNSAGSSSIVVTNGTSATMVTSTANITFTYLVLN